ncbi:hypothetical protein P280DRAFT_471270 [Massarina eburnea CBS 473.64]|uniref:Uncharacterized protein n=1 Tax=Massarina eburnea CBS 473.64 TaxID=1395130 RepID=A0A6A6RT69_9PLEO|nr:hypothetical protein P280DRAFT_471270 [Massarina eburnea CBS 473.64]
MSSHPAFPPFPHPPSSTPPISGSPPQAPPTQHMSHTPTSDSADTSDCYRFRLSNRPFASNGEQSRG